MSLTVPMICAPIVIASSDDRQLDLEWDSAGSETVNIAAGTYYILGDGSADDFCKALKTALETSTEGGTWTIALTTTGVRARITMSRSGGTDTIDTILIDINTVATAVALGLATSGSTITLTSQALTGPHRTRFAWCPEEEDYQGLATVRDEARGAFSFTGAGHVDIYTGHTSWVHSFPQVWGALVRSQITALSDHAANVPGTLATTDPNASLESWIQYVQTLCNGATPTLKWVPDIATPVPRSVRLKDVELYAGVQAWIVETNDAPLWHAVEFDLAEVS